MFKPKRVRVKAVIEVPEGKLCQDGYDKFKCPFLTPLWRCMAFNYARCEIQRVGPHSYEVYRCEQCVKNELIK